VIRRAFRLEVAAVIVSGIDSQKLMHRHLCEPDAGGAVFSA
jgi:hypothetical protein